VEVVEHGCERVTSKPLSTVAARPRVLSGLTYGERVHIGEVSGLGPAVQRQDLATITIIERKRNARELTLSSPLDLVHLT